MSSIFGLDVEGKEGKEVGDVSSRSGLSRAYMGEKRGMSVMSDLLIVQNGLRSVVGGSTKRTPMRMGKGLISNVSSVSLEVFTGKRMKTNNFRVVVTHNVTFIIRFFRVYCSGDGLRSYGRVR